MTALPPNGRSPFLKSAPAFGVERVQMAMRTRFNPIRNITPESLARALDDFAAGSLREPALIFQMIEERDDMLRSVVPKRKKAVARHGWSILTTDDSPEAAQHRDALLHFYNNLSCTHALDRNERGSFKLLVRQMMDAVGKRYAVHEIVWKPEANNLLTAEFQFVPLWFFENRTGRLKFLRQEFDQEGIDLEDGGWMVTVGEGLMTASAVAWMFKRLPLQDWLSLSEKFGLPGLLGKTPAPQGSTEWDNMVTALEEFAINWSAVVNEGAKIELIEAKTTGAAPQEPLIERMDRALARLWRGADLSTISKGQGVGASLQDDEGSILEEDDAEIISETLNLYVDTFVIRYLFGAEVKPKAYLKITVPRKKDIAQELLVDTFLRDSRVPIGVADALERYGRAMPEAGEAILQAPPTAPAPIAPAPIANEDQQQAKFDRAALDELARATAADLAPLRKRFARILQIEDPEVLQNKLRGLIDELPQLLKDVNADPAAAQTLERILAASLVNGLTRK